MRPLLLLPYYLNWHYGKALTSILAIIRNLVWFCGHLFSIKILLTTLFSPWQRMKEERTPGMEFGEVAENAIVNILMRFAGAIIRLVMVAIGLCFIAVILCGGIIFFALWLAFPLCIIIFFILGITFLFK